MKALNSILAAATFAILLGASSAHAQAPALSHQRTMERGEAHGRRVERAHLRGPLRGDRRKLGRPKAEAPKIHIGFRLAADLVESVKASGPGYNARVEQALRAAGFGAEASTAKKRPAKRNA